MNLWILLSLAFACLAGSFYRAAERAEQRARLAEGRAKVLEYDLFEARRCLRWVRNAYLRPHDHDVLANHVRKIVAKGEQS